MNINFLQAFPAYRNDSFLETAFAYDGEVVLYNKH